jgi:hypothetical protein
MSWRSTQRCWTLAMAGVLAAFGSGAQAQMTSDLRLSAPFEETAQFLTSESAKRRRRGLLEELASVGPRSEFDHFTLDVGPILDRFSGFLRGRGIPVKQHRESPHGDTLALSAAFKVRESLPAVSVMLGDHSPETEAFYGREGFRCALIMPVRSITFRLEAGEDSEFGAFGIAGAQWVDTEKRLAIGIGIPVRLRHAHGALGILLQVRAAVW